MSHQIEIENVGPVAKLDIPIPEAGGVVVLRGRNGSGKSRTIDAVEQAMTGRKHDLRAKDGADLGKVSAFGVDLRVGRTVRATGTMEVETLEGKLSIAELVDPGLKDQGSADTRRIKALLQVTGAKADPALFESLFSDPEEMRQIVKPDTLAADDLVVMAEKVKRDAEAAARASETEQQRLETTLDSLQQAVKAVGAFTPGEADSDALHRELEALIGQRGNLVAKQQAAKDAADQHSKNSELYGSIKLQLRDADDLQKRQGELQSSVDLLTASLAEKTRLIDKIKAELTEAQAQHFETKLQLQNASESLAGVIREVKQSESLRNRLAELDTALKSSLPPEVSDDEISSLDETIKETRAKIDRAAVIKQAISQQESIKTTRAAANQAIRRAAELRNTAQSVDSVLSKQVATISNELRVEAGRLVTDHPRRGRTLYSDLSQGERWKLALGIAIKVVGPRGVITIPQESWESLDPIARQLVADQVHKTGVVILTAECSADDNITANVI